MKSIEILTNRLANLRDSYDHYTMVDKDKTKAFWIKNDIEEVEILLNELNELKRLKDIEKELEINILEMLQDFKKQKENLGDITKEVEVDYLAHTVLNGITYRKLSEELGCLLEVVFRALEEGIVINEEGYVNSAYNNKEFNAEKDSRYEWLTLFKLENGYYFEDIDHPYGDPECGDIGARVKLSDYQKTWWLKGEKENA